MITFANRPRGIVAILLLAVLVRVACLWQFGGNLTRDIDDYRGIAENIVSGHGFANPGTKLPTAYRPPLYPLVLALVLWGGNTLIGTFHVLLGVITVGLTFLTAMRLGLSPRVALLAAALVAIDPLLVYNASLVMTETLAATLAIGTLALLADPKRNPIVLGIVFGLCCLCRPTFWMWGMFLVGPAASTMLHRVTFKDVRGWAQPTLLGIAVVIAPWAIRNAVVMGRPVVTTTHGGYTLLLGHNPVYYRDVVKKWFTFVWSDSFAWHESLNASMAVQDPPITDEISRDRWMYQEAIRNITEEPGAAILSGIKLLVRFWNVLPLVNLSDTDDDVPIVRVVILVGIAVFNVAVFYFLILGLRSLQRIGLRAWWPAVTLLASFTAVHFFYWADMRMRAPLIPAIALLAARGAFRETHRAR